MTENYPFKTNFRGISSSPPLLFLNSVFSPSLSICATFNYLTAWKRLFWTWKTVESICLLLNYNWDHVSYGPKVIIECVFRRVQYEI